MTNAIMCIAICLLTAAIAVLTKKQIDVEKELDIMATTPIEKPELDEVEHKFTEANAEIEKILARLEEIADDIGRLDEMQKQDHRELIDTKRRYVLYREPVNNGAGVSWAKDYPCNEDEGEE